MRDDDRRYMKDLGTASAVGIVIVVSVLIGLLLGRWLDRVFGTYPWLTLIFTFIGAAAGFIEMYRMVKGLSGD
ncbi:MAG: AtpZ/AtpI family protein [Armatimonadetes bacterium]|nr:AtpZ/AtpI family protein [Armatimonadota bacterium]